MTALATRHKKTNVLVPTGRPQGRTGKSMGRNLYKTALLFRKTRTASQDNDLESVMRSLMEDEQDSKAENLHDPTMFVWSKRSRRTREFVENFSDTIDADHNPDI